MSFDVSRRLSGLTMTLAVVGLGSCLSLIMFFVMGGPFGAINDVGNGALGLLSGGLAVALWRSGVAPNPGIGVVASSVAVLGAAVTVVGSVLILSDATGFFLAGLVSGLGFALIGVWLIAFSRWIVSDAGRGWPSRLPMVGGLAGAIMALGLINVPGLALGLDNMETAPGWIQAGGLSWLGTYILFPIWSIWFGRALTRSAERTTTTNDRHPAG